MEKIPKAEMFLPKNSNGMYSRNEVEKAMIEFAKLHVEAIRGEILESVPYLAAADSVSNSQLRELILSSYPLENIK